MLFEPSPAVSSHDLGNQLGTDSKIRGNIFLRSGKTFLANASHHVLSDLRHGIGLSSVLAALRYFVSDVISIGANPKVRWINTRSHVTVMQNVLAFRYWAIVNHPRNPVGTSRFLVGTIQSDLAITELGERASPNPTFVDRTRINIAPEPVKHMCSTMAMSDKEPMRLALFGTVLTIVPWSDIRELTAPALTLFGRLFSSHESHLRADWLGAVMGLTAHLRSEHSIMVTP